MNNEEINRRVAEILGWRLTPSNNPKQLTWKHPGTELTGTYPNYCGCLNACASMEATLDDIGDFVRYCECLCEFVSRGFNKGPNYAAISATAQQRALAFIRVHDNCG